MLTLVIPSIRERQLKEFFASWQGCGGWDNVILIEDNESRTFTELQSDRPISHYSHKEIADELQDTNWIISRRDSACRCFGFFAAWRAGADYVLTLDDDVRPHSDYPNVFMSHVDKLENTAVWSSSLPDLHPRGLPFKNVGRRTDISMSIGLWSGVPDLYAKTMLESGCPTDYKPQPGTRLLANGEYVPVCGMNLCIARKALPISYFPLMGDGQPYCRFDDIAFGIISKRICDHLNWRVSIGEPFVRHSKASDPAVNLIKEAPGIVWNEQFWQSIDQTPLTGATAVDCAFELGQHLAKDPDTYHAKIGEAMQLWSSLFRE